MQHRPLGRTGLVVTPIGLGLAALGRPGYITIGHADDLDHDRDVGSMRDRAHEVLDAAHELGIGYVDAARSYGRAEEFLAAWLAARRVEPGSVVIGSKWGYTYTADWNVEAERHEVKDHTITTLDRQRRETAETLGDHLRLYQIHSATLESGVLDDSAVLDRLAEMRADGLVIGFSTSGPRQAAIIQRALEVERDGRLLFGVVQATWNVLEQSATAALAEAHDAGLGVILKEAVANGRLTSRGGAPEAVRGALAEAAGLPMASLDRLAMAAVLAQPWADVVLSGAVTVEQLRSNAAAVEIEVPVDAVSGCAVDPARYWAARGALVWN